MFALNDGPRATQTDLRATFILSVLIKIGLLAALYWVTGGAEMAEDWDLHIAMGSDPVGMHQGHLPEYRQFPPMIGYFLAPGVWLVDLFGRFIGLRVWFLAFDLMAFALVLMALPAVSRRTLTAIFLMWTFVPLVPFAGFVMIQDEMIALVFAAAALLALSRKNETFAIAMTVWGVAAGKIFMIFAFPGFGFSVDRWLRIGVIGAGIAVIAYGPFLTGMQAVEMFAPDAVRFGVSYPTLLDKIGIVMTDMMGSPVPVVPELADAPASMLARVWAFTNGVQPDGPRGPLDFQPDIIDHPVGTDGYRPLRSLILVTWRDGSDPRLLTSAADLGDAVANGEVALENTGIVVNAPLLTWPGGQR